MGEGMISSESRDAGNPHVRFDERGEETWLSGRSVRHLQMAKAVGIPQNSYCFLAKVNAPLLDSTIR